MILHVRRPSLKQSDGRFAPVQLWIGVALVVAIIGLGYFGGLFHPRLPVAKNRAAELNREDPQRPLIESPKKVPEVRPSPHRNTQSDVQFVGTNACVDCHPAEHQSFLKTPHSQALGKMGDGREPPDGSFVHARSSLTYSIVHKGDQTMHRTVLDDEAGMRLAECEFPIQYHIGSGNHSRSYLLTEGDFLFESPLTWYAERKSWDLSPGYNRPLPIGFDRMTDKGCLVCHAGRVDTEQDNRYRPKILEATIGCESCHGPGALHVEHWKNRPGTEENQPDLTIVNPTRLTRNQAEQICSFCHLRGHATIAVRGRKLTDYRPGLSLSDFRTDYFSRRPDEEMTVTGHVEQMRLSKCYQSSSEMSCITCHDPHARAEPEQRVEHFRQKCRSCHTQSCGLPAEERLKQQTNDDCAACHMPRGQTDIPHIAFTHHRIGLHAKKDQPKALKRGSAVPELVAESSLDHLSAADQLRGLGLAYIEISERQSTAAAAQECRDLGRNALKKAYEQGIRDTMTLATLAGLEMERGDRETAMNLAQAALKEPNLESGSHENARFILAHAYLELEDLSNAEATLSQLVQHRRRTEDWLMLAETRDRGNNLQGALEALRMAEQMNPFHPEVQRLLTGTLLRLGQRDAAERHQRIESRLRTRLQNQP